MYLCMELIESLMKWREDVFFYLTYSKAMCEPEDLEFLNQYPERVQLIDVPCDIYDRLSELYMLRPELRSALNPWHKNAWDTDVVVSSRMPVLKHMPVHSARPLSEKMPWQRFYVGIEEMPILPFRDTVPWHDYLWPDTLATYGLADATLINNQWTKQALRPVLKEMLSIAWQKRILDKLHEVVPVKLTRLNMRSGAQPKEDFNVGFVGRMTSAYNFKDTADLFAKQFSYPIGPNKSMMRFTVSTNSASSGAGDTGDISFIDIQQNDREQFWKYLEEQSVVVSMVDTADFSLSTWETLKSGCPMILYDRGWTKFLGASYPFIVKNETEAYALLNKFAADYPGMYQKFRDWEASYWAEYIADPAKNITTAEKLVELLEGFEKRRDELTAHQGMTYEDRLQSIAADGRTRLDLNEVINETMFKMGEDLDGETRVLGRTPSTIMLHIVAARMGWVDTNETGVMVR